MKKPEKTLQFNGYEIAFKLSNYQNNGRLAVVIYEYTSFGCAYQYGVASVNIDDMVLGIAQTYMDENNNKGITQLFVDNGFARLTGYTGYSGYCQYPLVEIDLDAIRPYCIIEDDDSWFNPRVNVNNNDACYSFDDFLKECEEWDDIENEDASDDEDVEALIKAMEEGECDE